MPVITYRKALNDALAEELARDENVFIIGEEVAQYNAPTRSRTVCCSGLATSACWTRPLPRRRSSA